MGVETKRDNAVSAARFGFIVNPLLDLKKQRDQFALAMHVRLGKDGFQLIALRLPGNLQLPGGDIGRGAALEPSQRQSMYVFLRYTCSDCFA